MKVHCSTCYRSNPTTSDGHWVMNEQGYATYFFCSGMCEIKKLGVRA